jgi:hypothetical protein
MQMTESILIRASDLDGFIDESFPQPEIINNIPIYNNRAYPALTNLRTKQISVKGHLKSLPIDPYDVDGIQVSLGKTPTLAAPKTYQDVLMLDVAYGTELEQDPNEPLTYLDVSVDAAGEFLHISGGKGAWGQTEEPNRDPVIPATVFVPQAEWTVTWRQMRFDFFKQTMIHRLRTAVGRVNSLTIGHPMYDALPQTMLMAGWSMRQEFQREVLDPDFVGAPQSFERPVTISMKFVEKFIEATDETDSARSGTFEFTNNNGETTTRTVYYNAWNQIWKPDVGWTTFLGKQDSSPSSSKLLYRTYDMNLLMRPTDIGEDFA